MIDHPDLNINNTSSVPKYIQIVKAVKARITSEDLKIGDKLPSINHLSACYNLSRDTVEKAYKILKNQGIIIPVRGKGFYITHHDTLSKYKILLLFNKLSSYKKEIYNAFVKHLGSRADVTFHVYHSEVLLFKNFLAQHSDDYFNYYVIMPHFHEQDKQEAIREIQKIPAENLILLDNSISEEVQPFGLIYQDFKMDIYGALVSIKHHFKKYRHVNFIFPHKHPYPYPHEIVRGFQKFAVEMGISYRILESFSEETAVCPYDAFIVIQESDLVSLIKKARNTTGINIGENLGVLSYNETPLKEVLANGITVITTDFAQMGINAAQMILKNKGVERKNDFKVIMRSSF